MTKRSIPATTSAQRPAPAISASGVRLAARAFCSRRTTTFFSDLAIAGDSGGSGRRSYERAGAVTERARNLRAALGFLRLPPREPELQKLHRWPDELITVAVGPPGAAAVA